MLPFTASCTTYSITSFDMDAAAGTPADTDLDATEIPNSFDGTAVMSHDSFFGIKGSEDLGNGLSAVFQMEFSISGDSLAGVNNDHNTYVALAGSWGVAGIGQVDTPLNSSTASLELFDQQIGDNDQLGFNNISVPDAVFYMSPNWNGFSFVAGLVFPSEFGGNATAGTNEADGLEAVSVAAMYSNGPWYASLAYETISGEFVDSLLTSATDDSHDLDKWRLGLGYTANGWHVGFIYEDRELDNTAIGTADGDSWQLSASYTMGNNTFKAAYGEADVFGMVDVNAPFFMDDAEQWTVGVDHKLSNRTKVYAVYSNYSDDIPNRDWDALSLGIIHTF